MKTCVAVVAPSDEKAHQALRKRWRLAEEGLLTMHGAIVVRRDGMGHIRLADRNSDLGIRAAIGVGGGALSGLLAGPVGVATGGATADAVKETRRENATDEGFLALKQGQSAEVSEDWTSVPDDAMTPPGGTIFRRLSNAATRAAFGASHDTVPGPPGTHGTIRVHPPRPILALLAAQTPPCPCKGVDPMRLHFGETSTRPLGFPDWIGGDRVFFSQPGDSTPVRTTENGQSAQRAAAFSARPVKPPGLSTDTVARHLHGIGDLDQTPDPTILFPILADRDRRVARLHDMMHDHESPTAAVRSVFLIDPKMTIRPKMTDPMHVGRNCAKILRGIDALQTDDAPGGAVILLAGVTSETDHKRGPKRWTGTRPDQRLTVL